MVAWLPGIVANIAHFASPNEIACTWRLVNRATSQQFRTFVIVRLSLKSPAHVFKRRWGNPVAFRVHTWTWRLKLLCLTAASGSLENLEVALDNAGILPGWELVEAAAGAGQLEACKLLRQRGGPWSGAMTAAARGGHRRICEWLLASGCPLDRVAVYGAARGGHEDLMLWLLQRRQERNDDPEDVVPWILLSAAAEGLDLAVLQRLHQQQLLAGQQHQHEQGGGSGGEAQQQPPAFSQDQLEGIMAAAAGSPTPDWQAKVEWLEGLGYPRSDEACESAARRGPGGDAVGRLRWLHSRGYPMTEWGASAAARLGDMAALRFLAEQAGVVPGMGATRFAACEGHLAVLQYLHGRGYISNVPGVASCAAQGGHLPVVAWAVDTLGAITPDSEPDLMDGAALSGSVEMMAWLRERGWSASVDATCNATSSGCEEALEWLVERGCPWPADGGPFAEVARHGDLAMIRALHRLGCPWGEGQLLVRCVRNLVPVPSLRLLVELGCPADRRAMRAAAEAEAHMGNYRAAVLEWLGKERRRQSSDGMQAAV